MSVVKDVDLEAMP